MNQDILEKGLLQLEHGCPVPTIPSAFNCAASANDVQDFLWLRRFWDGNSAPVERCVSAIWAEDGMLNVFALMEDSDVFSDAVGKNDKTWSKGDVMELFIQPHGCRNYFELHLAPNFSTLELSIPDIDSFRSGKCVFEKLFFDSGMTCESELFSRQGLAGWWGLMKIPAAKLGIQLRRGPLGRFCVCRYNYTRNAGTKVEHSASAPLPKFNFHDPANWQDLAMK